MTSRALRFILSAALTAAISVVLLELQVVSMLAARR
jgi:hypothetical protein